MKRITKDFKKGFLSFFLLLLVVASGLNAKLSIPKDYKFIKCTPTPITQDPRKKGSHPAIFDAAQLTTLNWSGYLAATNLQKPKLHSVTDVSGSWVVPNVKPSRINTYSSIWVGIGGAFDPTLQQLGTAQAWINGALVLYAWFEMLPGPQMILPGFPVDVGDSFSASVEYIGKNVFKLSIANNTKKVHTVVPTKFTKSAVAKRNTAEWIVEAPFDNGILPLADFEKVCWKGCSATVNGVTGAINNPKWKNESITMASQKGVVKAVPSTLSPNGKKFNVTWKHR